MARGFNECCVLLFCFWGVAADHCVVRSSKALKLSINSRRNNTGHWIAQVQLDHGSNGKEVGPWDVNIGHATTKCDDEESVLLNTIVIAPPHGPATTTPPAGYNLISGLGFRGYYKLHTDLKTWHEALKSCEQEGAHLVVFNSEEEAKALSPLWDANPKIQDGGGNDWAHVGFHDQYRDKQYVTVFNESLSAVGYMKFYSGEPHERSAEDCGVSYRRDNLLGDIICNAKMPYFCELEL